MDTPEKRFVSQLIRQLQTLDSMLEVASQQFTAIRRQCREEGFNPEMLLDPTRNDRTKIDTLQIELGKISISVFDLLEDLFVHYYMKEDEDGREKA